MFFFFRNCSQSSFRDAFDVPSEIFEAGFFFWISVGGFPDNDANMKNSVWKTLTCSFI